MLRKRFLELIIILFSTPAFPQHVFDTWIPVKIIGLSYPRIERAARISGVVRLRVIIDANGSPTTVDVVSGHPLLGRSAQLNAQAWKFGRTRPNKTSRPLLYLEYRFQLSGDCNGTDCQETFSFELPNIVTVTSRLPSIQIDGVR